MKKLNGVLLFVVLVLVVLLSLTLREVSRVEKRLDALEQKPATFTTGLGEVMAYQQRWIDKLGLAAQAGNWGAAAFYNGEIKETVDDIIEAHVTRDNQKISALVKSSMLPAIEGVADAIQRENPAMFAMRYANLVGACNSCHGIAKVSFIHVTTSDAAGARWNQSFKPATIER
jgi:hypothetical protein